jgi:hypothetical protein
MLALTGYHAFNMVIKARGIMPGVQELVRRIGDDERRHMAWGTFTCRRHVAADDRNWRHVERRMNELLEPALQTYDHPLRELVDRYGAVPFDIDEQSCWPTPSGVGTRRLGTIESARGKDRATSRATTSRCGSRTGSPTRTRRCTRPPRCRSPPCSDLARALRLHAAQRDRGSRAGCRRGSCRRRR